MLGLVGVWRVAVYENVGGTNSHGGRLFQTCCPLVSISLSQHSLRTKLKIDHSTNLKWKTEIGSPLDPIWFCCMYFTHHHVSVFIHSTRKMLFLLPLLLLLHLTIQNPFSSEPTSAGGIHHRTIVVPSSFNGLTTCSAMGYLVVLGMW